MSEKITDIIPEDLLEQLAVLPPWARNKAIELVDPECPPPGVFYVLPAPRKLYLRLTIAKALVDCANKDEFGICHD